MPTGRMKILVLYAHPVETSFNAALHRLIVERLTAAGHSVDDCDLYAEDFDPRMTRAERLAYHDIAAQHRQPCAAYVERLLAAEALVLSFPVWNYGYPAILKGFFDRVFLPGVSFKLVDGKAQPSLHNISKVAAVTTYGGSRFRALLMGDPPRKLVNRLLRATVKPGAPVSYLAHYSMNLSTDAVARNSWRRWRRAWTRSDALRVLVVYCHPVPESFCAAVRDAAVATLTARGCEVRLVDLYAEGFDPVMRRRRAAQL